MLVRDMLRRPPVTIPVTATVEEAAEAIANNKVGLLVIVDPREPRKPLGVISERDVIRAIAGKAPPTVTVDKAGTMEHFVWIRDDEPIYRAADLMRKHHIRHLVVLDREGKLVGVLSIRDLIAEDKIIESLSAERRPATRE
ncbi:MAG: CBS domain-containing protein [Thermoproteus sp.]|nr:CBS domain-containing protein [Thermoproteus sp.]